MIVTDPTVSVVELMNARRTMKLRVCSTSTMFSHACHPCVGSENSSSEASCGFLTAVRMMNRNGTMKTTIETRIAMMPTR
jgi:hypothetical protein